MNNGLPLPPALLQAMDDYDRLESEEKEEEEEEEGEEEEESDAEGPEGTHGASKGASMSLHIEPASRANPPGLAPLDLPLTPARSPILLLDSVRE